MKDVKLCRMLLGCSSLDCNPYPDNILSIYLSKFKFALSQFDRFLDNKNSVILHSSQYKFLRRYLSLLAKHPVITKAVTSAILTLVGDLICQVNYRAPVVEIILLSVVQLSTHTDCWFSF